MLKAAIFDLDGILLDTEYYQWQGWVVPLKKFGVELSEEDYIESYAGKSGHHIDKELIDRFGLPLEYGQLLEKKEPLLLEWFKKPIQRLYYVKRALEFFKEKNIPLAVASGGGGDEVELKLSVNGINGYFQSVTTLSDVPHGRGKPNPDIYLKAAERMGVKPNECVVFEDTEPGVQSASNAGMEVYAVPTKWSKGQDFSSAVSVYRNLEEALQAVTKKHNL